MALQEFDHECTPKLSYTQLQLQINILRRQSVNEKK